MVIGRRAGEMSLREPRSSRRFECLLRAPCETIPVGDLQRREHAIGRTASQRGRGRERCVMPKDWILRDSSILLVDKVSRWNE